MGLNASKLRFSELLNVEILVELQPNRIAVYIWVNHNALGWSRVIPILLIANPQQGDLLALDLLSRPAAFFGKSGYCGNKSVKRTLVEKLTFEMDRHAHR